MQRWTLGKMQNPVRGFLDGGAALAALVGMVVAGSAAWGRGAMFAGVLVFSSALLIMYTVSTLYHTVPWREKTRQRLQRVDHSMIYLVVAGTFTPIAIASLEGPSLTVALGLVWLIAVVGIVLKAALPAVKTSLSVTLQLAMGWIAVVWTPQIYRRLGLSGVVLIFLGGLAYTLGVVVFVSKRPRLHPRTFSHHELFHVLVIAGSSLHFAAVLLYAIPAA